MREEGIEPPNRVWKTRMFPTTSLPRECLKEEGGAGLEPAASSVETTRSFVPFELTARRVRKVKVDGGTRTRVSDMASRRFSQLSYVHIKLVGVVGIEPTSSRSQGECLYTH